MNAFFRHRGGAAALEFVLMANVLLLTLAAVGDLGLVLYRRVQLGKSLSAASSYAIGQSARANSTAGSALAGDIAEVAFSTAGSNVLSTADVIVNNGPAVSKTGASKVPSGTAANADSCYCPSGTSLGAAVSCDGSCAGSSARPGKFVEITVSRNHSPIFSDYGIVSNNAISLTSVVQVQ